MQGKRKWHIGIPSGKPYLFSCAPIPVHNRLTSIPQFPSLGAGSIGCTTADLASYRQCQFGIVSRPLKGGREWGPFGNWTGREPLFFIIATSRFAGLRIQTWQLVLPSETVRRTECTMGLREEAPDINVASPDNQTSTISIRIPIALGKPRHASKTSQILG